MLRFDLDQLVLDNNNNSYRFNEPILFLVINFVCWLNKWQVLRIWLVTQNLSFMVAGCTVIALIVFSTLKTTNFTAFILLVILTNISGAVGVLSTLAGTILIEREW